MNALRITSEILSQMTSGSYENQEDSRETVLQRVSEALLGAGAERVRYYQIASEEIPALAEDEQSLFLTWLSYGESSPSQARKGFRIPLREASIFRSIVKGSSNPVADSYRSDSKSVWIKPLELEGREWIDVLVTTRRQAIGVLSFDWTGESIPLHGEVKHILKLMGELLGSQIAATSPIMEEQLQERLLEVYTGEGRGDALIQAALLAFQNAADIASLSLFRYEWTTQKLIRTWLSTGRSAQEQSDFSEESFDVGDKLTGRAFGDPRFRRILDFAKLMSLHPELLSGESVRFHEKNLGELNTVMYGVLGAKEPLYLIRAINHESRTTLPFVTEYDLMQSFTRDLSPYVDAHISQERAAATRRLQGMTTGQNSLTNLLVVAQEELNRIEQIDRIVVLLNRGSSDDARPYFTWNTPADPLGDMRDSLAKDEVLRRVLRRPHGEIEVIRRQDSGALGRALRATSRENADVAALPIRSGGTKGVVIFPVWGHAWGRTRRRRLAPSASQDFLSQVGAIIAQWAEQEYATLQAEGAQRALSLVGHEMTEPLAATKQLSERAIALARQAIQGRNVDVDDISDIQNRMRRHVDQLIATVQVGHLIGRQLVDGSVVGERQRIAVLSLTNFAITRTNREMNTGALEVPTGAVRITRPVGGDGLYLNCDAPLVEVALLNLLRNAVRYSVRSPLGSEVRIRVATREIRGSRFLEFAVANHGLEIPTMARDLIFDAFTRFASSPDEASRHGMGLGLFLCRQIALAHEGEIFLSQERVTGANRDDDAWRTTFTLRLKSDLATGPYSTREKR